MGFLPSNWLGFPVKIFPSSNSMTNRFDHFPIPIGSMYGIYANIGGILMVNVTIYSIHGSYGILYVCIPYKDHIPSISHNILHQWIGLKINIQEPPPYFMSENPWFFQCRFSLHPIEKSFIIPCFSASFLTYFDPHPLVNVYVTMENHHAINGKTHYFNGHFQ